MPDSFAARLARARAATGQTQQQVASRCGLHPSTYHRLEHGGRVDPAYSTLVRLVERGGLGLEHFFAPAAIRAAAGQVPATKTKKGPPG